SKSPPGVAVLKICLRLDDESPFLGPATVRVSPEQGNELLGMPADAPGEFLFSGVTSGQYVAMVGAPGYTVLTVNFKIADGPRQKPLYTRRRPRLVPAAGAAPEPLVLTTAPANEPLAPQPSVRSTVAADSFAASSEAEPEPAPALAPPPAPSSGRDFWSPHEL